VCKKAASSGVAACSSDDDDDEERGTARRQRREGVSGGWERSVAHEAALAGAVHTSLALLWQGLLCGALAAGDRGRLVRSGRLALALTPLLLAEALQARHQRRMVELAEERPTPLGGPAGPFSSNSGGEAGGALSSEQEAARAAMAKEAERAAVARWLRALAAALVMLKLGVFGHFSWWFALAPLWATFGLELAADAATACAPSTEATAQAAREEVAAGQASKRAGAVCHACCGVGFAAAVSATAAAKLSGASFSACWIFAPIFAAASALLLCVALVVCCAVDTTSGSDPREGGSSTTPYSPLVDASGKVAGADRPPTPPYAPSVATKGRTASPSETNPIIGDID
jgi:hypothetical protein